MEMKKDSRDKRIDFYGGKYVTFVPFIIFMVTCVIQAITGTSTLEAFWVNAFVCLIIGMFLSKNIGNYFSAITEGMGSNLIMTAIMCWIFGGVFAAILKGSGLVAGLIWLCLKMNITGGLFVAFTFLIGSIYSSATGTNLGTVTALTMVLYPAGIVMGANPIALAGAILSAGVFGDNFAPISDSTIVAAATLSVDVPTAVKIRIPYTTIAGVITFGIFLIIGNIGGTAAMVNVSEYDNIIAQASPKGLLMLIPAVITIVLAFKGKPLIQAITWGIISSLVIGGISGLITMDMVVNVVDGQLGGFVVDGIGGFANIILLIMMIGALSYIMQASGAMDSLLDIIKQKFIKTMKQADIMNFFIIFISAVPLCNGIVAEIIAGPLMKEVCDEYKISRYRAANFADAVNCGLSGFLPWGGSTLVLCALTKTVNESYSFVPVFSNPVELMPYSIYPVLIIGIYFLSAATGIGSGYDQKQWEKAKKLGKV